MNYTYKSIAEKVMSLFIDSSHIQCKKHIVPFMDGEIFLGDYFHTSVREDLGNGQGRYYYIGGPYNVGRKNAPQNVLICENEKLIYNGDFTDAIDVRTGAMDSIFLQQLCGNSLAGKKVLYYGSGGIARHSYAALLDFYGDNIDVSYTNSSTGIDTDFETYGDAMYVAQPDVSQYDIIIMHTNTTETILTDPMQIKEGAVVLSYISSTDHGELADSFYNSDNATVVIDYDGTLANAADLKRAIESGICSSDDIIELSGLLTGQSINKKKKYTIVRSTGSPLQNVAMAQWMLEGHE